jgi:hypothetical protein
MLASAAYDTCTVSTVPNVRVGIRDILDRLKRREAIEHGRSDKRIVCLFISHNLDVLNDVLRVVEV